MIYILLAAVLCAADQLFKQWIVANIQFGHTMPFIPGVLSLTNVRNTGMAFSLLSGETWLLAAFSLVVIAVLAYLLMKGKFTGWEKVCMALVMGGAAGNAIDRIFQGYVVDMFQTDFVRFAVFNLADAMIDVGAVAFCALYLVRSFREDRERRLEGSESDDSDRNGD